MLIGVTAAEAGAMIGVSVNIFLELVDRGLMPKGRELKPGTVRYDVDEIRIAFRNLPRQGGDQVEVNTWEDFGNGEHQVEARR